MAMASMTSSELNCLNTCIFTTINKIKNQHRRADIEAIHREIIKTVDFNDISQEHLREIVNNLVVEGKISNKLNRNKDSFSVRSNNTDTTNTHIQPNTPISNRNISFNTPIVDTDTTLSPTNSLPHFFDFLTPNPSPNCNVENETVKESEI